MIYFLRNPRTGHIKIGCTHRPMVRFREHVGMNGVLEMLGAMEGGMDTEHQIHAAFRADRASNARGYEWYRPSDDLMHYITSNADLPIPDALITLLATPIIYKKKPYKNRALFARLVLRVDGENMLMSNRNAAQLSGVPAGVIRNLLNGKVHHITSPNRGHYQRLAEWLGCSVEDLTDWNTNEPVKATCARCNNPRHVTSTGNTLAYCIEHWRQITRENAKRKRQRDKEREPA